MQYRKEIDGLRAVAVLPVILFHAGIDHFSGGFVGVDVFFVISGYLITTIIMQEKKQGTFSLVKFYERRARRILPALFFVMMCCLPFAWFWMFPAQLKDFAHSLIAVSLFASNILFWRESGYFAPAAEEKPLLHTWSLAVEEQYYMFFPLLILVFWRFRYQYLTYIVVICAIASLALSEYQSRFDPSANFYLAPTRAWELLAGVLCAFYHLRRKQAHNNALSILGFALILYSIFAFTEATRFPSLYALVPVVGASLVILFASNNSAVAKLLSMRGLVIIGQVSYSAYLWHQPLFAFARIRSLTEPAPELMMGLSLVSLILAYFTWYFIETPFRRMNRISTSSKNRRLLLPGSLAFGALFVSAGVSGHIENGFEQRPYYVERFLLTFQRYERGPIYREGKCLLEPEQQYGQFSNECANVQEKVGASIIWGDSHAAALSYGLRKRLPNVVQYTASACPPVLNTAMTNPSRPHCQAINTFIVDEIQKNKPVNIYLHANWALYDNAVLEKLSDTLKTIKEISPLSVTYIVGSVPQWLPTLPALLVQKGIMLEDATYIEMSRYDKIRAIDDRLKNMSLSNDAKFLSILDLSCKQRFCKIAAKNGEHYEPFAWDYGHLTAGSSIWVANQLISSVSEM